MKTTAAYSQYQLNGDAIVNGAVLNGAWQDSFTSAILSELGVMQRARPDYEAKGLPLGGFRLYPVLDVAGGYNDNIFATPSATVGDEFLQIDPSLDLRSQWGRDFLSFYGGSQITLYDHNASQNITNWDVGSSGKIDILDDADIRANVYYDGLHEPRTSPDEPGDVAKPTAFDLFHGDLAADYKPDRLGLTLGGSWDNYMYQNTPLFGSGVLDNGGRNENVYTGFGRITYELSPGYEAFVGGSYQDRAFLRRFDMFGYDRSSTGYNINAGAQFFISHLIQGQAYLGYLTEDFKSTPLSTLPNVGVLDYGASISWYATPLLTLHLGATRALDDTTIPGASASDDQTVYASADYELLRDVLVQGQVGYLNSRFVGITRTDKVPTANFQVTWLINHNFSAYAKYGYNDRSSDAPGQDYTQNIYMIGIKAQL